jgi:PKD repeat protein
LKAQAGLRHICIVFAVLLIAGACGGNGHDKTRTSGLTPNNIAAQAPTKAASIISADERLVAREPSIVLSTGGYTLAWKYENPGDYNQDGIVALEDLAPIAQHFGEAVSDTNEWIKGSAEGTIGIAEITPIAMNWGSEVIGYRIDGAESTEGLWSEVAQVELADANASDGRLGFTSEIAPGYTYYRVVTVTPGGDGAFTEPLLAPSAEPIIYGVSPTSGYQHEEYAFTATASGQEPLMYAWDVGGGATPNTSSDISPTVTLSDAGSYSATLTISNSYGPTTFPLTLTVNARDSWIHTWGGTSHDSADEVVVDNVGNVYVIGETYGVETSSSDILLLKYDSSGDLLFAKTWGGVGTEHVRAALIGSDQNIVIVGYTDSFGAGDYDVLVLKVDTSGDVLSAKTWGNSYIEYAKAAVMDSEGNLYIAGEKGDFQFDPWDIFLLKLDSDGELLFAETWSDGQSDFADAITIGSDDAVHIVGRNSAEPETQSLLLKVNNGGALMDSKTVSGLSNLYHVASLDGGNILVWGMPSKAIDEPSELALLEINSDCQEIWNKCWAGNYSIYADKVIQDQGVFPGRLLVGTYDKGNNIDALVALFDSQGEPLWSKAWSSTQEDSDEFLQSVAVDIQGNMYFAGAASSTDGEWQDVALTTRVLDLSIAPITGTYGTLALTEGLADGVVAEAIGILDTGGGWWDALLMKNALPGN